eukprot:1157270-Pelagomonas_calceolata.AAC.18
MKRMLVMMLSWERAEHAGKGSCIVGVCDTWWGRQAGAQMTGLGRYTQAVYDATQAVYDATQAVYDATQCPPPTWSSVLMVPPSAIISNAHCRGERRWQAGLGTVLCRCGKRDSMPHKMQQLPSAGGGVWDQMMVEWLEQGLMLLASS